MNSTVFSIALAVSSMMGFGVADFFTKIILSKAPAIRTALISQGIGTLLFLGVALYFDFGVPSNSILFLTLISGILSAIALCSYYVALSIEKASLVAPIFACLNVVAVILSISILRESLSILQLSLIVCVFAGILLVAFERSTNPSNKLGIILALLAALLAGGNAILQKLIASGDHFLMSFTLTRFFMLSFMFMILLTVGETHSTKSSPSYRNIGLLGLLDVTSFFAWYLGLRFGLVAIVTPIANSSPVLTVILAHLFLKERVGWPQRVGIVAILVGITALAAISQ